MKSLLSNCVVRRAGAAAVALAVSIGPYVASAAIDAAAAPAAAKKQRQYKCTKCRQVFTFDGPGNYKCPSCNKPLIPVN